MQCAPIADGPIVEAAVITALPTELRAGAAACSTSTGGLHAAALFDPSGELSACARTSAGTTPLDKLVGSELLAGHLPLSDGVLLVSGRASFEIIQKAATAGIPIVCAVSAPSSLAVDAARRFGMTLVGFLRDERFNVYTRPDRIGVGDLARDVRRRVDVLARDQAVANRQDVDAVPLEPAAVRAVARAVHSLVQNPGDTYSRRDEKRMSGHRSKMPPMCARTAAAPTTAGSPAVWFWNTMSSV